MNFEACRPVKDPETIARLAAEIRARKLTYCGCPKLENIAWSIHEVQKAAVPGMYIEAGVALGGSAVLIAMMKPANVPLALYDVFAQIPAPGESDGADAHERYREIAEGRSKGLGGDVYYGYRGSLETVVQDNLASFGINLATEHVTLSKGLFQDTLHPPEPVALAHIDCDWYDSVRVCIDRILPKLSPGGILVFDDYNSYSGCRRAVDEALSEWAGLEMIFNQRSVGIRLSA